MHLHNHSTSASSSANLLDPNKVLTAGQQKALEDKKAGRHADVIDTWDPTGLGSASESLRDEPDKTNPYSVASVCHAHIHPIYTANLASSGPYDAAAPSRNTNLPSAKAPMRAFDGAPAAPVPARTGPTTISLADPPVPPAKDEKHSHTRTTSAVRTAPNRRTSGGLSGQYSTSMPAAGGYFPPVQEPLYDSPHAQKSNALKAAWGTAERECGAGDLRDHH
jgi:hypothetical protein